MTRELEQGLQRLVDRAASARHTYSVLVGVDADDGSVSIRSAAGSAGATDAYPIASIAKLFTATMVMQLIDEQRLHLDDRVVNLLPDLDISGIHRIDGVDRTPTLELHHLLHQTSGLPDYFAGGLEEDFAHNRDRCYSVADIIDLARLAEATFPPGDRKGTRSEYSDTNYQLLTAIIEAATGASYGDCLSERLAQPLGLADTYVAGHGTGSVADAPYLPLHHKGRALHLPNALASERGAGGIISTLDDQVRFSQAYHQGQLFHRCHTDRMRQWNRIFFPVDYGYGVMHYQLPRWMTGRGRAPQLIGHSGATNSFTFYVPELGCHIAGTMNQLHNPARSFRLILKVADLIRTRG